MGTLTSLLHRTATGPDHLWFGKGIFSHTQVQAQAHTDTLSHFIPRHHDTSLHSYTTHFKEVVKRVAPMLSVLTTI